MYLPNELILILSIFVIYGGLLAAYYCFGKTGLYGWTVFATLAANIEVLILVNAFGMEMTLGNVIFASNFLVTDIMSEMFGKKEANKAANLGIATSFMFIIVSQSWFLYTPAANDWASESIRTIFANTPRLMAASFLVYAICQKFDVWMYHKWWELTTKKFGDSKRFLWLRNNGSTMLSQLINTILYTFGAFGGMYDMSTLINICISTYVIYIMTSLADTPFIYAARRIKPRG